MKKEIDFNKIKRHPACWWNYLLLWLATKKIISLGVLNKLKWTIKK